MDEDDSEEDEEERLPWDQQEVPLPADLVRCLKRVAQGDRLPLKSILNNVPAFSGLPRKAQDNNHGADGRSQADRWLKGIQQRLLTSLRLLAAVYEGGGAQHGDGQVAVLLQQAFYYVYETEEQVLRERKRRSLPGSVANTANPLFGAEDLRQSRAQQQLNGVTARRRSWSCFPTYAGKGGPRYKGGRGRAPYGYGSQQQYRPWRPFPAKYGTCASTPLSPLASAGERASPEVAKPEARAGNLPGEASRHDAPARKEASSQLSVTGPVSRRLGVTSDDNKHHSVASGDKKLLGTTASCRVGS